MMNLRIPLLRKTLRPRLNHIRRRGFPGAKIKKAGNRINIQLIPREDERLDGVRRQSVEARHGLFRSGVDARGIDRQTGCEVFNCERECVGCELCFVRYVWNLNM